MVTLAPFVILINVKIKCYRSEGLIEDIHIKRIQTKDKLVLVNKFNGINFELIIFIKQNCLPYISIELKMCAFVFLNINFSQI